MHNTVRLNTIQDLLLVLPIVNYYRLILNPISRDCEKGSEIAILAAAVG